MGAGDHHAALEQTRIDPGNPSEIDVVSVARESGKIALDEHGKHCMRVAVIGTGHVGLVTAVTLVDDLVEGLWRLLHSDLVGPVNLGNPKEVTVRQLAELTHDITLASEALGWRPAVPLREGLVRAIAWARSSWMD